MTLAKTIAGFSNNPNKVWRGRGLEGTAAAFLGRQGCQLLARNYQCRGGEVDLVMMSPVGELLFVEVRSRCAGEYGNAGATVVANKRQRVRHTAAHYLRCNPQLAARPCRFDVVAVDPVQAAGGTQLSWLRGAFE